MWFGALTPGEPVDAAAIAALPDAQRQAYTAWWDAYKAWQAGNGPEPTTQPPIVRRIETLNAIWAQCGGAIAAGNPPSERCQAMLQDAEFRDRFPLELGWGPQTTINLERGELYPTPAIAAAMWKWIACETGKIVACIPGSAPPAGVLRPGDLTTAGAAAASGTPPPPKEGVVLPPQGSSLPALPTGALGSVPWWVWPAAVGLGVVVVLLATGRRKAA